MTHRSANDRVSPSTSVEPSKKRRTDGSSRSQHLLANRCSGPHPGPAIQPRPPFYHYAHPWPEASSLIKGAPVPAGMPCPRRVAELPFFAGRITMPETPRPHRDYLVASKDTNRADSSWCCAASRGRMTRQAAPAPARPARSRSAKGVLAPGLIQPARSPSGTAANNTGQRGRRRG